VGGATIDRAPDDAQERQQRGFCVGRALSLADIFLVPQVRNALGAGVAVEIEFPAVWSVWCCCLSLDFIRETLEECGGVVQPQPGGIDPSGGVVAAL
jgi:hypothetical protein